MSIYIRRNIYKFLVLIFVVVKNSFATTYTYQHKNITPAEEINLLVRSNNYSLNHNLEVARQLNNGEIFINENNKLTNIFQKEKIEHNDKITLRTRELKNLKIHEDLSSPDEKYLWLKRLIFNYTKEYHGDYYPCIIIKAKDGERKYGLIAAESLSNLVQINDRETSNLDEILNHANHPKLTILYAVMPKNRAHKGKLLIKYKGNWLLDEDGSKLEFPVLGQSKLSSEHQYNGRLYNKGDTPQGIYRINGVMSHSNDHRFGDFAYLDIDNYITQPHGFGYDFNSFLLEELLPKSEWNKYWLNELSLAQNLGRNSFRIHGNNLYKLAEISDIVDLDNIALPTAGCLNLGSKLPEFMKLLAKLKLIDIENFSDQHEFTNDVLYWNISDNIGKIFLIVIDKQDGKI